ncbi:MAG: DUF92 domain-containing protein [Chloroflexia bacterium]
MPEWNGWRLVWGAMLSLAIAGVARHRRALSRDGFLGAVATGTLTLGFGGWAWGLALVAFFLTSTALTRWRKEQKRALCTCGAKGGERDLWQVLANGGVATLLAVLSTFMGHSLLAPAFAGSLAAATADTWATEVGMLSRRPPRRIVDGRVVPPGTSGGVTALGLLVGSAGALFLSGAFFLFLRVEALLWDVPVLSWEGLMAATAAGIAGMVVDSLLGATLQGLYRCPVCGARTERRTHCGREAIHTGGWKWLNNDGVNLAATLSGALLALLLSGRWT